MSTTVNTPLRSDFGFKSPQFTVDAQGNISATTLTLASGGADQIAADFNFIESAGNFRFDGESNNQPTLTVYRNQTTTIDLAFTTLVFKIFSSVAVGNTVVYSSGLRHSDSTVGVSAQGKNTGRLTWTIPLGAPDTLYYGNVDGTVYGIINVLDQGEGFKEKDTNKIFKRFYSNRPDKFGQHSGLGLNIVKNLVDLHNASIKASNRKDRKGASMEIIFPKV